MVLATFISICIAAVLFMLRFLLALDSEAKASQTHSRSAVALGGMTSDAAQGITLLHSRSPHALRPRRTAPVSYLQNEQASRYKVV